MEKSKFSLGQIDASKACTLYLPCDVFYTAHTSSRSRCGLAISKRHYQLKILIVYLKVKINYHCSHSSFCVDTKDLPSLKILHGWCMMQAFQEILLLQLLWIRYITEFPLNYLIILILVADNDSSFCAIQQMLKSELMAIILPKYSYCQRF